MAEKVRTKLSLTIARRPLTKSQNNTTVLIVGAGPVGLLIALRLGQASISTLVLESHQSPPHHPSDGLHASRHPRLA
jgi:cation diffusion facilitator CzcD-associated flavoprotein CzcO